MRTAARPAHRTAHGRTRASRWPAHRHSRSQAPRRQPAHGNFSIVSVQCRRSSRRLAPGGPGLHLPADGTVASSTMIRTSAPRSAFGRSGRSDAGQVPRPGCQAGRPSCVKIISPNSWWRCCVHRCHRRLLTASRARPLRCLAVAIRDLRPQPQVQRDPGPARTCSTGPG